MKNMTYPETIDLTTEMLMGHLASVSKQGRDAVYKALKKALLEAYAATNARDAEWRAEVDKRNQICFERHREIIELQRQCDERRTTAVRMASDLAAACQERDQLGAMCAAYEEKFKMQREIVCAAQDWRKEPIGERSNELAAAVDALDKWAKERAAESAGSFTCPTCGPHVKADEDGCCATCGEDCKMEGA